MRRAVRQPHGNISFTRGMPCRTASILCIVSISVITDRLSRTGIAMDEWSSSLGGGPFGQRERPERRGAGPQVIVAAVDDSPMAEHAVGYGAGLARRNGGALVLVYVRHPPPMATWCSLAGAPFESIDVDDRGLVLLKQIAEVVRKRYCVTVSCKVCDGNTAHEVARVADEFKPTQ